MDLDLLNSPEKPLIAVAMSGGVDSSVTALLLKQEGYRVIGLFMKNWDEVDSEGTCPAERDFQDVQKVCQTIDIPYYSVNFVTEYREKVFDAFLQDLKKGLTPNPDVLCNKEIKFKILLDTALKLGAHYLATGHYCQVIQTNNHYLLMKGKDPGKDQSYFLYTIGQKALSQALFPIGSLLKKEVRQIAARYNLATAQKPDSTGICFIGERNFKHFISQYLSYQPGPFHTLSGKCVGQHDGVAYYTIGQRKGLGIGGAGEAWFVVGKNIDLNIVYVEQGALHPALFADDLIAKNPFWISGSPPQSFPFSCHAKIRYRQEDQSCTIVSLEKNLLKVLFHQPQRAITPQQSIVFYEGNQCLGGAVIESSGPNYYQKNQQLPF